MPAGNTITMTMNGYETLSLLPLREGVGGAGRDAAPPFRCFAGFRRRFPTGAYAYSHGLEWAVDAVTSPMARRCASGWPTSDPRLRPQRRDPAAPRPPRTDSDHAALNELAVAIAPSRERRTETLDRARRSSLRRGMATAAPSRDVSRIPSPSAHSPARTASQEDTTTAAYLQAFTANLISAAVRLVPLGQSAGLRVLAALEPTILRVAAASRAATLDDLGGCAFRSDLAAMRHETQYTRLFRS